MSASPSQPGKSHRTELALPDSERTDAFRRATTATFRALSGDTTSEICFLGSSGKQQKGTVELPYVSRAVALHEVQEARGGADAAALRMKHHSDSLDSSWGFSQVDTLRNLYDTLEQVRCEVYGARNMAGVQANLEHRLEKLRMKEGYHRMGSRDEMPATVALPLLAREFLSGKTLPQSFGTGLKAWRETLTEQEKEALTKLSQCQSDQAQFARACSTLFKNFDLGSTSDHDALTQETPSREDNANDEAQTQDPSS